MDKFYNKCDKCSCSNKKEGQKKENKVSEQKKPQVPLSQQKKAISPNHNWEEWRNKHKQ